jgi:cell division protein FtsQ
LKKIIHISLWSLFALGTLITLGFVQKEQKHRKANKLDITVNTSDNNYFVTVDDIRQLLNDRGDSIVHQSLSSINIPELEMLVNNQPAVQKAEVYVSVNGEVRVTATQRKPIARIFSMTGESYYMDDEGKLMPLSSNYTADVVAVNGAITESYGNWYHYSVKDIEASIELKQMSILDDIYRLCEFIRKDPVRKSLIGQIYVNSAREFELIPAVGSFRIILGDANDLDEKFNKLMVFYRDGLRNTGEWNKYSLVTLKYKNQIVCTKRI